MFAMLFADLRFGLRLIRRAPAFYGTLIAVIATGIGGTTAMFSIVYTLLLRPLPYLDAGALTAIRSTAPWTGAGNSSRVTLPDFLDFRAQARTFAGIAAIQGESLGLTSEGAAPERVAGAKVSGDFFGVLGVAPARGRLLSRDDDRAGAPCAAVVSSALWRRRFGSDPALIGRAIGLNAVLCRVVGIAPDGFGFGDLGGFPRADVWTALAATLTDYARMSAADRSFEAFHHFLNVLGRRRPGVSLEQAQADLSTVAQRLGTRYPYTNGKKGVLAFDLQEFLVRSSRSGAWLLFASVTLVLLVVCANVANLLFTRMQARRGELAARVALGATRARLVAQVVSEIAVVFLLGAAGGALLAHFLVGVFSNTVVERGLIAIVDLRVDRVALGAGTAACVACGLVFALVPALSAARVEPHTVLRESAAHASLGRGQRRAQSLLVVAQVALAFVLLSGSGLTLRALARVSATPLGFEPGELATASMILPEKRYPGGGPPEWAAVERVVAFYRAAVERAAALPGVQAAAANGCVPIACGGWSVYAEGRPPPPPTEAATLGFNVVTPGYFATMKIPILRGRDFTAADRADTRLVTILSRTAAERLFPGQDPIGRRIDSGVEEAFVWREVVGVVGDVRSGGVYEPPGIDGYFPLEQTGVWDRSMTLIVRSPRAEALLREIPELIRAIDPDQDVAALASMRARLADSIETQRQVVVLLGAFALFALLLAALGFFALVSYATGRRTRELGIRLALGATPEGVVALVLKSGLGLLAAGLALGAIGALLAGGALSGRVPEIRAFDAGVFAVVPAILGLVGLLGCFLPARRAARIAPARALRYE